MVDARFRNTLFACLISIGSTGVAFAQIGQKPSGIAFGPAKQASDEGERSSRSFPVPRSTLPHSDRKFIATAAKDNMAEMELADLASKQASDDRVKHLSDRMVTDHGRAGEALRELAQAKGVTMPATPSYSETREIGKLAKLSGAAFDRESMDDMTREQQKAVKEFRKEAGKAKDTDVKNFAQHMLPVLEEDLSMLQAARPLAERKGREAGPR